MKKLVFLFSLLALVFISCNKDEPNNDGTLQEQEITYAGTYEGNYKLADTSFAKEAVFFSGLLKKDRLKLYGVVDFDPTDTAGFYRANVNDMELAIIKSLLGYIGVNVPNNADDLIKGMNATALFDGDGKVVMNLNFEFNVQVLDTMKLNWQLIRFEGLRK
ncbi:MAG: hypothetical protein J6Y34_07465 [Bacteroidales bacterium]|nr:hypothetical protein [Bacteroidales bacterium]